MIDDFPESLSSIYWSMKFEDTFNSQSSIENIQFYKEDA